MNENIQAAKELVEQYFPNIRFSYIYTKDILVGLGIGEEATVEVVYRTIKTSVILSFEKEGSNHSTNIQYSATEDHLERSLKDGAKLLQNRVCFVDEILSSCL